ncbi:MAG: hypothetical protein OXT09_22185, partial [Myxococcales bacterium]|nr:hypothetical protein [Myxococcales bacterium]
PGGGVDDNLYRSRIYDGKVDANPAEAAAREASEEGSRPPPPDPGPGAAIGATRDQSVTSKPELLELDDVPLGKQPVPMPKYAGGGGAPVRDSGGAHDPGPTSIGVRAPEAGPRPAPEGAAPVVSAAARHGRADPAQRRFAGTVVGREVTEEPDPPPLLLRLLMRVVIGVALFLFVAMAREFGSGEVDRQLAGWDRGGAYEDAIGEAEPVDDGEDVARDSEREPRRAARDSAPIDRGPPALKWLESELHQVSSGDKDGVRALVKKLKRAGALEVYMGRVMRNGPLHLCGELIVELPDDRARRQSVLRAYAEYRAAYGVLGGVAEPEGRYLRVMP